MTDYQGNSHASKDEKPKSFFITAGEERKKLEPVITTEVITRKKPTGRRFKEIFFGGDLRSVSGYVAADVIFPAIRNLIADVVIKGMERYVFGESAFSRRRTPEYKPRTIYNNPINRQRDPRDFRDYRDTVAYLPDQPPYRRGRPRQDMNEIILSSRQEAETVLESLLNSLDLYGVVSVADLNDLVGLTSSFVDQKWGWLVLHNIEIRQVREGYLIDLPAAEAL